MKVQFYYVDEDYINFLKSYEQKSRGFTCVPNIKYTSVDKFVYGAVISVNGMMYFVPVSHQIDKNKEHNLNIKIKDKNNTKTGSLRFPYMIPIPKECLEPMNKNSKYIASSQEYKSKVSKELAFCRKKKDYIENMAIRTYKDVCEQRNEKLSKNACDFKVLEAAYIEYCKLKNIKLPVNENATKSDLNDESTKLKGVANKLFNENISLQIENAELSMENETLKAQLTQAQRQIKEEAVSSSTPSIKPAKPKR